MIGLNYADDLQYTDSASNQMLSDSGGNLVDAYKIDFQNGTLTEIVR
jgi:hypothetical protein